MSRRIAPKPSSPTPQPPTSEPADDQSVQFLLAEFALIKDIREATITLIENRIKFIVTLQGAEVALIGVLLVRSVPLRLVALVAITIGLPTLLLSHIVYLRALDFQIQGRRYLRAINAIRRFFTERDASIVPFVLMSTDPKKPKMSSVGDGSSVLLSFAVTMLILTAFMATLMAFAAAWLGATALPIGSPWPGWIGAITAVSASLIYVLIQVRKVKTRLRNAERADA